MQANRRRMQHQAAVNKSYGTNQISRVTANGASMVNSGQKNSQDVVRVLKKQLDEQRNENEELRSELQHITQAYLTSKAKMEQLITSQNQQNQANLSKEVDIGKAIEKQVKIASSENMKTIKKQKEIIEKYRKYKICLSKNVWDLQERLKATRLELQLTQKQLYQLQAQTGFKSLDSEEKVSFKKQASSNSSAKSNGKRSNKIVDFDDLKEMQQEVKIEKTPKEESREQFKKRYGGSRGNLMVAKSLALARTLGGIGGLAQGLQDDKKKEYDWLFNDEGESSRRQTERRNGHAEEEVDTDRALNIDSAKKMINRASRHPENDDRYTATNSNSLKSTPNLNNAQKMQNCENFSETLQSERDNADDLLLNLRKRQQAPNTDLKGGRASIVKTSLQGVKNIFKKAAEGLREDVPFGKPQNNGNLASRMFPDGKKIAGVQLEQVTIELDEPNGQFAQNTANNRDSSIYNDQNPLDDDSN